MFGLKKEIRQLQETLQKYVQGSGGEAQDTRKAREAMLKDNPSLGGMYHIGDGIFEVLRLEDVKGCKCSFTAPPEEL